MQPCNEEEASTIQPCYNLEPSSMETCDNNELPASSTQNTCNSAVPSRRPKGTGRKKIEIFKKIENDSSRKVAFSKRRKGLFNKTEEICKLCPDAEIAIIVFSTKGRLFSYGYPSVEHVVNRFLSENRDDAGSVSPVEEAETEAEVEEEEEMEENQHLTGGEEEFWFDESTENLDMEELEEFAANLEGLRLNLSMKKEELIRRRTSEIDFLGKFVI